MLPQQPDPKAGEAHGGEFGGQTDAAVDLCVGIAVSRYHREVTESLLAGARDAFLRCGGRAEDLYVAVVPGAFELPLIVQALADDVAIDAVVALGCVVTGETRHDEYINISVANALQHVALETSKPVAFGVLTVAHIDQARARAGLGDGHAHGNKGAEAMMAALSAVHALCRLCEDFEFPQELSS